MGNINSSDDSLAIYNFLECKPPYRLDILFGFRHATESIEKSQEWMGFMFYDDVDLDEDD